MIVVEVERLHFGPTATREQHAERPALHLRLDAAAAECAQRAAVRENQQDSARLLRRRAARADDGAPGAGAARGQGVDQFGE